MSNPLVSIIIPTYNRAHLIGETLDSILMQSYKNWECIIVDDGSSDDTEKAIEIYTKRDNRFKYFERPSSHKSGGNGSRNYGFEVCQGELIKWFDSDDLMHKDLIMEQVEYLKGNKEADFCAVLAKKFERWGEFSDFNPSVTKSTQTIFDYITGKLFFLTPSPLWRKSFLKGKKLFDEDLFRSQEADFHFRRLIEKPLFSYINMPLLFVRRGHASIDSGARKNPFSLKSQFDYFQTIFFYLLSENSLSRKDKINLIKYVIFRQAQFLESLYYTGNKAILKESYIRLRSNALRVNINVMQKTIFLAGIFSMYRFGKGHRLINNKNFDLRK